MPCQTVTVEAKDESTLSLSVGTITSPAPNTINVSYSVSNEITSGGGETLTGTVQTTLNGSEVDTRTVQVPAGETESVSFNLNDVPSGSQEICVEA